jgi:oxalate---CoA ligase
LADCPNDHFGATDRQGNVSEPATIGAAILRHAELRPSLPAVVSSGFQELSYRELAEYLKLVSMRLRQGGFDCDARIGVALPNGANAALAIAAIASAAVAVPIDTQLTAPEIERRLALLRPHAVIVPANHPSAARDAAVGLGLGIIDASSASGGKLGLDLCVREADAAVATACPDAASTAFILQTSGTTADPKLIPFSHRNMLATAARVQAWFGLSPADRCLNVNSICYSHGLYLTFFNPLITGGSVAFPTSASRLDVAEWFVDLGPTWYSAAPTLQRFVLDKTKPLSSLRSLHSLRFIVSSGAPLAREVQEDLEAALGVPVVDLYGTGETAQISSNLPGSGPSKPETCGIPDQGIVRIVGRDGREVAAGVRGEILVGGPTVISGYLNAPELNRIAFVDGWFQTGDIGSLDVDGFLTLHGRENELINRGGEKISPVEIDDALMCHPEVVEAAAFGMPHQRLGEDVAAAVVLKAGATPTPLDLRKFLQSRLAQFKIPRRIIFLDHLPKGATGKIQRRRLVGELSPPPHSGTRRNTP